MTLIFLVIWLHFIADFILQSDYISKNKSKSNLILLEHVLIYAVPFVLVGVPYAIINSALHYGVDGITSRMTSKLYAKGDIHKFFVVIGADQAIHMTCLIATLSLTSLLW